MVTSLEMYPHRNGMQLLADTKIDEKGWII